MSKNERTNGPTHLPDGIEARYRPFAEFRVDGDDEGTTLTGHAATFDDPYDLGPFEERIEAGAFDRAIKEDDVRALWNHDPNHPLGRLKSGTLRLSTDDVGLVSEIDLPRSAEVVREAVERGDVDQMSFAFRVTVEEWEEREDDKPLRTLKEVELWDVSPVTFPANPNTDVGLRSLEALRSGAETTTEADTGISTLSMEEFRETVREEVASQLEEGEEEEADERERAEYELRQRRLAALEADMMAEA